MTSLRGIRIHLSGAVPEGATDSQAEGLKAFVLFFAKEVLRQGGTLVHGSHPTLVETLKAAAFPFVRAGGARDAMTLVRSASFASTAEQKNEIDSQREWSVVHIIPALNGDRNQRLIPMRDWMAERCDVVVAVGGKWYNTNQARAGVPRELDAVLQHGKPGFIVAGFGGAMQGLLKDDRTVLSRLCNGWGEETNLQLSECTDATKLVNDIIKQITLLPLVKGNAQSGRLFRILSLDGGGLRGTFTAAVLAKWANMLGGNGGHEFAKHFDLIAGTSTGAILAIGLGLGLTPLEMLSFYREKGPKIFPKYREFRHWRKSKHDAETLEATLVEVFQARTLSADSRCRLVIPTVRAQHGVAEVIVTAHSNDRTAFKACTAVQAALASAAAPTYFDEAVVANPVAKQSYLDGGVWANNPVLPAIVEAVRHLGVSLDRIDVLSVGTMGSEIDFSQSLGSGKAGWAAASADLFVASQESGAVMLANGLLSRARHLRINQNTPSEIKLDDTAALTDMAQRGDKLGQDTFDLVRSRFLDGIHAADWRDDSAIRPRFQA